MKRIKYLLKYYGFQMVYLSDESTGTTAVSLTNGMELLIKDLSGKKGIIDETTSLYYKDTCGEVCEVMHNGKSFVGFGAVVGTEKRFLEVFDINLDSQPKRSATEVEDETC